MIQVNTMKKLFKRLLNNKGLTLTELIVALFLTSVILAIAVGMLAPVKDLMNTLKSNAHMDTMCATANEYVRGTLQTARNVTIIRLDGQNGINPTNKSTMEGALNSNTKVLAVLDIKAGTGDEPVYRVFDFSDGVSSYSDLADRITNASNAYKTLAEQYGAFNEPYYENTSFVTEFYNSSSGWLQVASQCYRDGEAINQKHVLNFKLLNSSVSNLYDESGNAVSVSISGDGASNAIESDKTTNPTLQGGSGYVIIYTL